MTTMIAVHGFMYGGWGRHNDPKPFFEDMARVAGREVEPFSYYSVPFGLTFDAPATSIAQTARAWLGSWFRGYLHPYRYAWAEAEKAGDRLARRIKECGPVDLICHSLGSRVVICALKQLPPELIRKVVIFNGAELRKNARVEGFDVMNIAVRTDDVLKRLGSKFSGDGDGPCIGQAGMPRAKNFFLDDPDTIHKLKKLHGWEIQGDNPNSVWDHWWSYRFGGNADLVRWFLKE